MEKIENARVSIFDGIEYNLKKKLMTCFFNLCLVAEDWEKGDGKCVSLAWAQRFNIAFDECFKPISIDFPHFKTLITGQKMGLIHAMKHELEPIIDELIEEELHVT